MIPVPPRFCLKVDLPGMEPQTILLPREDFEKLPAVTLDRDAFFSEHKELADLFEEIKKTLPDFSPHNPVSLLEISFTNKYWVNDLDFIFHCINYTNVDISLCKAKTLIVDNQWLQGISLPLHSDEFRPPFRYGKPTNGSQFAVIQKNEDLYIYAKPLHSCNYLHVYCLAYDVMAKKWEQKGKYELVSLQKE